MEVANRPLECFVTDRMHLEAQAKCTELLMLSLSLIMLWNIMWCGERHSYCALQAACAPEERFSERAAEGDGLGHAMAAQLRTCKPATSQAMEEEAGYFSRFQTVQTAHEKSLESDRVGQEHGKRNVVQEEHSMLQQHFVPAKPVRLL